MVLKQNKHYKNCYNNPKQFDFNSIVETMERTEDEKLLKILSIQCTALRDAKKDKENNNYKFI